jgi:hypothetical protein
LRGLDSGYTYSGIAEEEEGEEGRADELEEQLEERVANDGLKVTTFHL